MTAYVIADIHVTDPKRYEQYKESVPGTLAAHGGRYIARTGEPEVLEGGWKPGRVVILEFESAAKAREWWGSKEYAELKALRQASSNGSLVLVEGARFG